MLLKHQVFYSFSTWQILEVLFQIYSLNILKDQLLQHSMGLKIQVSSELLRDLYSMVLIYSSLLFLPLSLDPLET